MANQFERAFFEEIKEKKKSGRGAFNKKGKGVKHRMNGIKTPYDFLNKKEREALSGKVEVYKMNETILTKEEFEAKDESLQKLMLERWRELYTNQKIIDQMGISQPILYSYIRKLGIKNKIEKPKNSGRKKGKATMAEKTNQGEIISKEEIKKTTAQEPVKLLNTGLSLEYSGIYNAEQLGKILTKLQIITEGEENKYTLVLSLQENIK